MKKSFISLLLSLTALVLSAADAPWTPSLEGRTFLNSESDALITSGRTDITETPEGPAMKFLAGRKPAIFNGKDILNDSEGTIDLFFKFDFPAKLDQHTNSIFSCSPFHLGINTEPSGKTCVFFFSHNKAGKKFAMYKAVKITSGKWHRLTLRWTPTAADLWLDGVFVQQTGMKDCLFKDKQFKIGEWDWGHCRALLRDFRIYKKAYLPGAIKVTPVQKKNVTKAPLPLPSEKAAYPVKTIAVKAGEPFADVFSTIGGNGNILQNNNFAATTALPESLLNQLKGKKFFVENGKVPANFTIHNPGAAPWTSGKFALVPITLPDGSKGNAISLDMPENKWNQTEIKGLQKINPEYFRRDRYYGGFWAKGDGTFTIRLVETGKSGRSVRTDTAFLLTDQWKFYRTEKPVSLRLADSAAVSVDFLVYGKVEFAMPEIAPMPVVDRSAKLTFYAPFDNGLPQAAYSEGTVQPLGPGENFPGVPGVDGSKDGALRISRSRRFTPSGFLRVKMPLNFDNVQSILDPDCGTVELWFHPLPEMAKWQMWRPFNIFSLGSGGGSWSKGRAPISLAIDNSSGEDLRLILHKTQLFKAWPSLDRSATSDTLQTYEYDLGNRKKFVSSWHHIALTYSDKGITVYLDGKAVIKTPAMKKPLIYNNNLLWLGGSHVASPGVLSSDMDNFKIFRGVRYHGDFTPEKIGLTFKKAADNTAGTFVADRFKVGEPALSAAKTQIIFPVSYGDIKGELILGTANGAPLIFSSKDQAMSIIAKYDPTLPLLAMEKAEVDDDKVSGTFPALGTNAVWKVDNKGSKLIVTLELDKDGGQWRTFLEGRVFFRNTGNNQWVKHFDGYGVRNILSPFAAFAFDRITGAIPLSAAWNQNNGIAIALAPEVFTSYLSRGMSAADTQEFKVRTVLDKGDKMKFIFEVYAFNGKYDEKDAVDFWHRQHPEYFARRKDVDPRLYSGPSLPAPWPTPAYYQRIKEYSHQEINRRARCQWSWIYKSGTATGNWAPDPDMLANFSKLNKYEVANADYHSGIVKSKGDGYAGGDLKGGINGAPYISQWLEKRMVPYFRSSIFEHLEMPGGVDFKNGYWWPPIVDYIAIQSGTEYGRWLLKQIKIMLNFPLTNAFSHDELVGDYFFRKEVDLGGARAFDRDGAFVHNLTAMGIFAENVINLPNRTPYRSSIIGNGRISNSGYPAMIRTVNNIYERTMHWAIQDWVTLRQHNRIMGEKPCSFWIEGFTPIIGNYFRASKDDIRLLKFMFASYYHQHLLAGMLFNVNMHPGMLGFKEVIANLDELRYAQEMGYRQTVPLVPAKKDLPAARYGEPERGVIVLVNPGVTECTGGGTIDTDYFNRIPLIAENGKQLTVKNGTFSGKVPALFWQMAEMLAGVKCSDPLEYTSSLERTIDRRELTMTMTAPAKISEAVFGLGQFEVFDSFTVNGRKYSAKEQNSQVIVKNIELKKGDKVKFICRDRRWLAPAAAVVNAPYLTGKKLAIVGSGQRPAAEAGRLREYFRFWTQQQPDMTTFTAPVLKDMPGNTADYSVIVRYLEGDEGISIKGNVITVSGKGHRLQELNSQLLQALDKKYVYYGVFGDQMATKTWDHTSTREQKELQNKCNAVKNLVSVQESIPGFIEYIKEKNIDPYQGF